MVNAAHCATNTTLCDATRRAVKMMVYIDVVIYASR